MDDENSTLTFFGFFAKKIRDQEPDGFTFTEYVKNRLKKQYQNLKDRNKQLVDDQIKIESANHSLFLHH